MYLNNLVSDMNRSELIHGEVVVEGLPENMKLSIVELSGKLEIDLVEFAIECKFYPEYDERMCDIVANFHVRGKANGIRIYCKEIPVPSSFEKLITRLKFGEFEE